MSMTQCEHSPLWSTPLGNKSDFKNFISQLQNTRSQDLPNYYQLNGAIYLVDKHTLFSQRKLFLEQDYYPYIMPAENSVDIDTQVDFIVADTLLKNKC